jgi:hypothetical protein
VLTVETASFPIGTRALLPLCVHHVKSATKLRRHFPAFAIPHNFLRCRQHQTAFLSRFHDSPSLPRQYITSKVHTCQGKNVDTVHSSGILLNRGRTSCRWSQSSKRDINVPVANTNGCRAVRRSHESARSANRPIGTSHARYIKPLNRFGEEGGIRTLGSGVPGKGETRSTALQAAAFNRSATSSLKGASGEDVSKRLTPHLPVLCTFTPSSITSYPHHCSSYISEGNSNRKIGCAEPVEDQRNVWKAWEIPDSSKCIGFRADSVQNLWMVFGQTVKLLGRSDLMGTCWAKPRTVVNLPQTRFPHSL